MDLASKPDYQQICRLQNENYQLRQEVDDLKVKYQNLKKQQKILDDFHLYNMPSERFQSGDTQELSLMKEQFVGIVRQKQQQEQYIKELRQKVQDMKYTMQEMRQLGEKQQRIHLRQVELFEMEKNKYQKMLQDMMEDNNTMNGFGTNYNNRDREIPTSTVSINKLKAGLKQLQRKLVEAQQKIQQLEEQLSLQKQHNLKNIEKLQKCSQIAKQMQQYYTNELEAKQLIITQLETQLNKYNYHEVSRQYYEMASPHTKLPTLNHNEDSSLKCSSIVSQYHHQQILMGNGQGNFLEEREKERLKDRLQDKYREMVEDMRSAYGKQIDSYQDKIKYLTLKIQALQAQKSYLLKNSSNLSGMSDYSHSQTFIAAQHLQSIESLNHTNTQKSMKSYKNPLTYQQQSMNLKLSKTSMNNESIREITAKSQISQSVVLQSSQSHRGEKGCSGVRTKVTQIKTPIKGIQKSLNLNRNSGMFQRVALGESNGNIL